MTLVNQTVFLFIFGPTWAY